MSKPTATSGMVPDDKEEAKRQLDEINALSTRLPDGGWLSTLVWNTRNNYLAWPDGTFPAQQVQLIVEGFLAEIEAIRASNESTLNS